MHIHYRVTFTEYIRCFGATTSHNLVTLTFDLLTLRVFHVHHFLCPTHVPIFIILRLSVTELRVLNIWSHFCYLKQSLRMRRVTWPLTGGKNSPHFWNPCYRQKNSVFQLWRLQSLLRVRSIMWPVHRRSPKTIRNIFWPRIAYSLYNFYAAAMTIKGSLYLSIPMLKRSQKTKSNQNRSPKWRFFWKFKGPNIKYSHRDPRRHFLTRNDVIWRIWRKYPPSLIEVAILLPEPLRLLLTMHGCSHNNIRFI